MNFLGKLEVPLSHCCLGAWSGKILKQLIGPNSPLTVEILLQAKPKDPPTNSIPSLLDVLSNVVSVLKMNVEPLPTKETSPLETSGVTDKRGTYGTPCG